MALSDKNIQDIISQTIPEETKNFIIQQTMYRIKDPEVSLKFYINVLGMKLLHKMDFPSMEFTVYFLGYTNKAVPSNLNEKLKFCFHMPGTLELTHNWGSENDESLIYHNGNSEPRGYGHIGISVPDVYALVAYLEGKNVEFKKKPGDGKMKGITFIKDPDGYLIEFFDLKTVEDLN